MGSAGTTTDSNPAFQQLLVHADDRPRPSADRRVVAELLALRGVAGDFVVPAGRGAWRPLLAYNRLRPARVRIARAGLGLAIASGLGRLVGERRTLTARPGDRVLLDYLSTALGEPGLVFAGHRPSVPGVRHAGAAALHRRRAVRRVRQARLGPGDPAHDRRRGRRAPARACRRRRTRVRVPEVLWHGYWQGLAVMVTAPMPTDIRRLPRRAARPGGPARRDRRGRRPVAPTPLGDVRLPPRRDRDRRSPRRPSDAATCCDRAERIAADFGDARPHVRALARRLGPVEPRPLGRHRSSPGTGPTARPRCRSGSTRCTSPPSPPRCSRGASRAEAADPRRRGERARAPRAGPRRRPGARRRRAPPPRARAARHPRVAAAPDPTVSSGRAPRSARP